MGVFMVNDTWSPIFITFSRERRAYFAVKSSKPSFLVLGVYCANGFLRTLFGNTTRNEPRNRDKQSTDERNGVDWKVYFDRRRIINRIIGFGIEGQICARISFFLSFDRTQNFIWNIEDRISFNWKRERRTHWLISESRFADRFRARLMPPQIITADFNVNERKAEAWPDTGIYSPDDLCGIALTASLPIPRNVKNILNDSSIPSFLPFNLWPNFNSINSIKRSSSIKSRRLFDFS